MLTDPTDIDAAIGRALGPKKRASAPKGLTAPPAPKPFDDNQPVGDKIREEYRQRRDVDPVVRRKMRAQQDAIDNGLTEVAAELGGKRAAARLNVLEESEAPTSSPARITELSRKYGVPAEVVRVDPKLWEARDRRERSVEAFGNSPKLEAWTAEERVRAALITDDLDALVGVENALSPAKRADIQRRVAEREEYRTLTADPKKALEGASPLSTLFSHLGADTLSVEQEDSSFMGGLRSIGGGAVNTLDIMWNGLAAQLADATYGLTGWEAARADSERLTQANQRLGMVQQLRRPDYGYAGGMVYDGFNSLALMAPGMAASIYSGNATPALTSAFLLTQPEAYTKYRARGASGGEAFLGSMLEGGIEVAMEKMPMGVLVDNVGKSATRQWIGEYLVKEGVTEQLTTFGQDAVDTAIANPNKSWGDFLAERPEAALRTAVATLVASGSIGTINTTVNTLAGRMERDLRAAQAGERTAEFVTQLKGIAEASKMREADVTSFENWVKTAAEGSGATDVYIEASKLVEVLEQSGMTSEQITEALPSLATTLGPAAVSGGDVRIPIEELVARGTEVADALAPHLRINPEEMSQEQAKVYMQGAEEAIKEQAAKIMGEAVVDEAFRVSVDNVREGVLSQLNTANRFTADVNAAYASLHANFFARLALDAGVTPEEMAARYPLAVTSGEVAGDRVLEQQVAYHGTRNKFRNFDVSRSDGAAGFTSGQGVWLDSDPVSARQYAELAASRALPDDVVAGISDLLAQADAAEKARDFDRAEALRAEAEKLDGAEYAPRVMALRVGLENPRVVDASGAGFDQQKEIDAAREAGNDGVVFNNISDTPKGNRVGTQYLVFDPSKVAPITVADRFGPENIESLLDHSDWAVMTAENPNAEQLSDAQNARRNAQLRADLDALGVAYSEAIGSYGQRENSFAIVGLTEGDALQLAERYQQESVLTNRGLVYRDGSVNPAKGIKKFKRRPKDFFTEVEGSLFSVEIDFDTRIAPQSATTYNQLAIEPTLTAALTRIRANSEPSQIVRASDGTLLFVVDDPRDAGPVEREVKSAGLDAEVVAATDKRVNDATAVWLKEPPIDEDGNITLQHFSATDDLAVLDPSRWGTSGRFLPESERAQIGTAPPRTYFGIATGQPGGYTNEFSEGAARYEARVPAEALYDIRRDPDGLKKREGGFEKAVAEAGYLGYWTQNNQLGLVAVVFHPTEVKQVGPTSAFKRWFKNSKVVDENGAPLVVYHGTDAQIDAFRTSGRGFASALGMSVEVQRAGVFFTPDPALASEFTQRAGRTKEGANVIPVYLSIQKPFDMRDVAISQMLDTPEGARFEEQTGLSLYGLYQAYETDRWEEFDGEWGSDFIARLKDAGYDGAIITEPAEERGAPNGVSYVAFDATQIKSVFNSGAFDPDSPFILNQDAPVFYSALARAIETSKQAKAPAAQWKGILQNAPGVKAEELEWSGLLDALDFDPQRVMTREELAEVVAKGGIVVDEVVLGSTEDPIENERPQPEDFDDSESYEDALQTWLDRDDDFAPPSQFSNWSSDPENGTYRELLMTLPIGEGGNPNRAPSTHWDQPNVVAHVRFMEKRDATGERVLFVEEVQSDWHQKGRDQGYETKVDPAVVEAAQQALRDAQAEFQAAQSDMAEAMAEEWQRRFDGIGDAGERNAYADAIPQPSPDWTYQTLKYETKKYATVDAVFEASERAEKARLRSLEASQAVNDAVSPQGVPRAPFQSSWPALVMKRVIRWAVDNGYRKVAWTTGEQQAARYDLSQATGDIGFTATGDGRYWVSARQGSANSAITEQIGRGPFTAEQIEQVLGRDIAARGIAGADASEIKDPGVNVGGTLFGRPVDDAGFVIEEGEDLRVGGEGMKAFYDRNLVNITNGLVKKYGAKVGAVAVPDLGDIVRDEEYANVSAQLATIIGQIRRADAAGGREKVQERIGVLRALKPGDPGYLEIAAPSYLSAADSMEAALPLYDEYERLGAEVEAMQREGRGMSKLVGGQQPGFEITPELAAAATHGFPMFQRTGAPRGQIAFGADITMTPTTITLLRGADLSTFLHETGHFFLEVMADVAARPDAPARVADDLQRFFAWSGVKGLDQWRQMTPSEKRAHHERFARGFEAYLFEGALPSIEMAGLFQRFKTWLQSVYRSIAQLDVELTDEVRGVFDRMFAAEAQIKEAQALQGMEPMFTEKPKGMTDDEWDAYQRAHLDATREAKDELERRSLRDMRYASNMQSRELKRLQREVKTMRADLREEAQATVAERPEQQAIRLFRAGETPEGQTVEGPVKISIAALTEAFEGNPDGLAAAKKKLGFGKNGVLAKEGMSLADAAMLTGYSSGDHLLQELLIAEPFKQAVETELDILMSERYGDLTSPEALRAAVDKAIHNRVRGRFVATELAALDKAPGKAQALAKAAKAYALAAIGRTKIRDLRPAQYEAAERRAAKNALEAHRKDDIARAAAEKRNQLVNYHAARAAREAEATTQKILRYFKRFDSESTRKNLDPEYRDQIDQLLEKFDLRKSVSNKEADRRKSLLEWVERQRDRGFEPLIPEELLTTAGRTPYRELTVDQFSGVYDAVRNIEHLARLKKKLLTAKKDREFADAVDDIANSIERNSYKVTEEVIGAKTWTERLKTGVKDFFAFHRKFANLAHVMDGNQYGGDVWEYFVRPMNDRGDWQTTQNEKMTIALGELFDRLKGQDTAKREYVPEVRASLSLEDRLMVALNLGNEGNAQRLMDGDKWEQPQLNAVLAPLTAEHWAFVQATWDYIDSFWPMIRDKELRVNGIAPEKVEANPFTRRLADGTDVTLRGGYFPIKYDPDRSTRAEADSAAEVLQQMTRGLYTSAQTRRGHTKARSEEVNRPVRKDFGVIFEHLNQVTHDLAWHEYLIDANRLLRASAVDGAIRQFYGPEVLRWMRKALEDIAVGDIPAQNVADRVFNHLRSGASIAGLGWNLWTSLLQPIGLTQTAARIGTKWVARGLTRITGSALKLENAAAAVYERSEFMRLRAKTMQREINEIRNRVAPKSPLRKVIGKVIPDPIGDVVADSFFVLIAKAQLVADLPTWIGMYEKQIEAGQTEERAADLADQAVLDSQGGGQIKDLAGVQRGSPIWKLWTNFYSYFNTTYNLIADRSAQLRRVGAKDLPYFAVDVFMLSVLPSTITTIMYEVLKGGADDDWDELAKKIAQDNVAYMAGLLIGVREVSAAITGNAGYSGPAGARIFAELNKLGKQVSQGEADEAMARAGNSVAGIILHYPSGQVDRTVRGIEALVNGEGHILSPFVGPPVE